MQRYRFLVEESAADRLLRLPSRTQWKLHDYFARLATDPAATPDLLIKRADEKLAVKIFDDWLIHYWVDHAVRQVIVVALEHVDD
jgi:hypothetical protein